MTLALPAELLRQARHLAVDRGVSLSRCLAQLLEERLAVSRGYEEARRRQLDLLEAGLPLGTEGRIGRRRDELDER